MIWSMAVIDFVEDIWKLFQTSIAYDIKDAIMDNIMFVFDSFQSEVNIISTIVGQTPQEYNSTVFGFIKTVQENAVLPIALIILSLVMCHELITMIIDKNNMADCSVADMLKWIFKTTFAIVLLDNSFDFVCAIFELAQHVVNGATSVISTDVTVNFRTAIAEISIYATELTGDTNLGGDGNAKWLTLFQLYLLTGVLRFAMLIVTSLIHLIVILRMFEIYMMISLCPIPFSTLGNREFGQMGQHYIKSMFALAFQSFFMILSIGIFGALLSDMSVTSTGDVLQGLALATGYCLLLVVSFAKTGSYANRVFGVG